MPLRRIIKIIAIMLTTLCLLTGVALFYVSSHRDEIVSELGKILGCSLTVADMTVGWHDGGASLVLGSVKLSPLAGDSEYQISAESAHATIDVWASIQKEAWVLRNTSFSGTTVLLDLSEGGQPAKPTNFDLAVLTDWLRTVDQSIKQLRVRDTTILITTEAQNFKIEVEDFVATSHGSEQELQLRFRLDDSPMVTASTRMQVSRSKIAFEQLHLTTTVEEVAIAGRASVATADGALTYVIALAGKAPSPASVLPHLPPVLIGEELRVWLDANLLAGQVEAKKIEVVGGSAGLKSLIVDLDVAQGHLRFHPDWPMLTDLEGSIAITDHGFEAQVASAKFLDLPLTAGTVILDSRQQSKNPLLKIKAQTSAPLKKFKSTAMQTPLKEYGEQLVSKIVPRAGAASLALALQVGMTNGEILADGHGQIQDADVEVPELAVRAQGLATTYAFDTRAGGQLTGKITQAKVTLPPVADSVADGPLSVSGNIELKASGNQQQHVLKADGKIGTDRYIALILPLSDVAGLGMHLAQKKVPAPAVGRMVIDLPEIKGHIERTSRAGNGHYQATFAQIHLPEPASSSTSSSSGQSVDPRNLPTIDATCDSLRIGNRQLHKLVLKTSSLPNGLAIEQFDIDSGYFSQYDAKGHWHQTARGQETELAASIYLRDGGKALRELNVYDGVTGLTGDIHYQARLPSSPLAYDRKDLKVDATVDLKEIALRNADSSLLRIADLLTLNIMDFYRQGAHIEHAKGRLELTGDVVNFDGMALRLGSGNVKLRGAIDLSKETLDTSVTMNLRITRTLGAVALGIINPGLALGYLGAEEGSEEFFGSEIFDGLTEHSYRLVGTWQDPKVERF